MDGTLVDTEPYWMDAETALVASFGGVWTREDGMQLVGNGLERSAEILRARGVDLPVPEIIDRLTHSVLARTLKDIPWRPGALDLLHELRTAGIPTALVTMSMRPLAAHIAFALERPLFDVVVTGEDVSRPKPDPEAYLQAAGLLGVGPGDCIAIEDSVPGLASATAAGAVVIGVPAHLELPESEQYTLWPTLAGRSLQDLVDLHRGRRPLVAGSETAP
jgi:HAD superfamily hydrolase (TIGR01509 family)